MTDPANGRVVLYTFNGAGVTMWQGPPAEIGGAVDTRTIYWQPVAYDAAPDQMYTNRDQAINEFLRLVTTEHPGCKFELCGYSEGTLATGEILDRMGVTQSSGPTDLAYLKPLFLGGCSLGDVRRQGGHTIGKLPFPTNPPTDPGGVGIVTPNLVGTPDNWWCFANPGDFYTACLATGVALEDVRAIMSIVMSWTSGLLALIVRITETVKDLQILGMAEAIYYAMIFFGVKHLEPHTTYEITTPIPGYPSTCIEMGVYHLNRLAAGYYP